MLLYLAIVVALQLTAANGFLEDCPIDRKRLLGFELVVDKLERFYNDLVFVGAATETCLRRDYTQVLDEMNGSESTDHFLDEVVRLLDENHFEQAENMLAGKPDQWYSSDARRRTYLSYFRAEANRLIGRDGEAFEFAQEALADRQISAGISVDALERLNSLLTLKGVLRFNQDVDRACGLTQSPNYKDLPLVHEHFKYKLDSFEKIRAEIAKTSMTAIDVKPDRIIRTNPELDDLSGQSAAMISVESILCEFARKLQILELSTPKPKFWEDWYNLVLRQIKELDLDFGVENMEWDVVRFIVAKNMTRARENLYDVWKNKSPLEEFKLGFIHYFNVELDRRSKESCYLLAKMQQGIDAIKRTREVDKGIQSSSFRALEAKVLFRSMDCVHHRLSSFYHLVGNEDAQELGAKRAQFGRGEQRLPNALIMDELESD